MRIVSYSGPIENIIVVMLENRSYDNVLGFLYGKGNQPPYVNPPSGQLGLLGLNNGGPYSNIDPKTNKSIPVWGAAGDAGTIPAVDPGEEFDKMAQQILGLSAPEPLTNPYAGPLGPFGAMGGFVANYERVSGASPPDIMHAFVPATLSTSAYLANTFMVCDQWFASAPTQTFANRMFSLAASPGVGAVDGGYLDDTQYMPHWLVGGVNIEPNLLSRLDTVKGWRSGQPPTWKIYFHDYSIAAKLLSYARAKFESSTNVNVANFDWQDYPPGNNSYKNPLKHPTTTFQEDLEAHTLPPFSLIEPRYTDNAPHAVYGLAPNSNHPGIGNYPFQSQKNTSPTDTFWGEFLLYDIYLMLRLSKYYWPRTLLIITYDEHGGLYDHIRPPKATPPGSTVPPATGGFGWNYFGGRVPTIIVSSAAPASSRLIVPSGKAPFDHTSIIATAWDCFGLDAGGMSSINARDGAAMSILGQLNSQPDNNPDPELAVSPGPRPEAGP